MQSIELRFMRWIRKKECNPITFLLHFCTELGSYKGWTIVSLLIIFFVDASLGWSVGLASLFGGFCAQIVKLLVRRQRPCIHPNAPTPLIPAPDPWSFPSGHTTSAFSVSGMLWYAGHDLWDAFTLFALLVGFSRIYLGVHYPSDVCVGVFLGMMCGYTFGTIW